MTSIERNELMTSKSKRNKKNARRIRQTTKRAKPQPNVTDLNERIARRDWFMYLNVPSGIALRIDRVLIRQLGHAIERRLGRMDMADIPSIIAGFVPHIVSRLNAAHRQGCKVAQAEWCLPQLGCDVHFLSDGEALYASGTPLLSYNT